MSIRDQVLGVIRRIVGTQMIVDILREDRRPLPSVPSPDDGFVRLPGSNYAKYLLPIEYAPSREYAPRWGYSKPVLEDIHQLFYAKSYQYIELVGRMRANAQNLQNIPIEFDEQNLPMPAWTGVAYSPFDALVLHTLICEYHPSIFLEIGSGITTCFAKHAAEISNLPMKIISIDPEPRAAIDEICDTVIRNSIENVDDSIFSLLKANDIVFLDGSHRSFMNSDVTIFFLEILPKLPVNVLIHIHDVTLPWDYPPKFANWYWNEQYFLALLLQYGSTHFEVIAPTHFMCQESHIRDAMPVHFLDLGAFNDGWRDGGAMWLRKIK